jgi:hypothetical protein
MTDPIPLPASRRLAWCLWLAFLACYPLSQWMPPAWAWENGMLENIQVALLLAGALWALLAWRRLRPGPAAVLAACAVPVWLLLAGRECSWGAVFLPPLGFDKDGPVYASRILWYRPLVGPFAGAVLGGLLLLAWRHRLGRLIKDLIVRRRFPWGILVVVVVVGYAATFAEGHLRPVTGFIFDQADAYEELAELVGYLALLAMQGCVLRELAIR